MLVMKTLYGLEWRGLPCLHSLKLTSQVAIFTSTVILSRCSLNKCKKKRERFTDLRLGFKCSPFKPSDHSVDCCCNRLKYWSVLQSIKWRVSQGQQRHYYPRQMWIYDCIRFFPHPAHFIASYLYFLALSIPSFCTVKSYWHGWYLFF